MLTSNFPRAELRHRPTPLAAMPALSAHLGGPQFWIKRDDCTGLAMGGNKTLQQYLNDQPGKDALQEVELFFGPEAARFVGEQRYMFGFVDEERQRGGVKMRFLTHVPEFMARWLLLYTDDVEVVSGDAIKKALQAFSAQLSAHWDGKSKRS